MEIREIKSRVNLLASEIERLIVEFELVSSVQVSDVSLTRVDTSMLGYEPSSIVDVDVRVEL